MTCKPDFRGPDFGCVGIDLQAKGLRPVQGFPIQRVDLRSGPEPLQAVGALHYEQQHGPLPRFPRGEQLPDMLDASEPGTVCTGARGCPAAMDVETSLGNLPIFNKINPSPTG